MYVRIYVLFNSCLCLLQRPGEASSGDASKPKVKGLLKAKSPWKRPVHKPHEEMEQLHCKFRGILNKLTPTKFQTLAEQALQLEQKRGSVAV